MMNLRVPIAAMVSLGVTFGLFLFMHKLISSGGDQRAELGAIAGIHFGPVEIPDEIVGIAKCVNPKCITNNEAVTTRFEVVSKSEVKLKCHYCEKITNRKNIEIL